MAVKLTTYDPAEDLTSDAATATFMAEAFATEDSGYIAHALGVVACAKGMAQTAEQTGLSSEQLDESPDLTAIRDATARFSEPRRGWAGAFRLVTIGPAYASRLDLASR